MDKITEFVNKRGLSIMIILSIVLLVRTCSIRADIDKLIISVNTNTKSIAQLDTTIIELPTILNEDSDYKMSEFLYWERELEGKTYDSYSIKDYYKLLKK